MKTDGIEVTWLIIVDILKKFGRVFFGMKRKDD
jgi:hypothetical protein